MTGNRCDECFLKLLNNCGLLELSDRDNILLTASVKTTQGGMQTFFQANLIQNNGKGTIRKQE